MMQIRKKLYQKKSKIIAAIYCLRRCSRL